MTLVVEDGTGLATADSYVDLAFADEYHAARGNQAWSALTGPQKEARLRKGTVYVDQRYHRRWTGVKATFEQSLQWPRRLAVQDGQFKIPDDHIPDLLKHAVAEAALRSEQLHPDATSGDRVKREKVDVIEVEFFEGATDRRPVFTIVDDLLIGLVRSGAPWLERT